MIRKLLAVCVALAVPIAMAACAAIGQEPPIVTAQRGITAANQLYVAACGSAFSLTGEAFNKAKAGCIAADDALDKATIAYEAGNAAVALANLRTAQSRLADVDRLTPK